MSTREHDRAPGPGHRGEAAPSLTVVVVTWNSAAVLPGFLAALPAAMAGVQDWELVVADNASSDDTVDIVLEAVPHARVVQTGRNAGYSAGINAALAVARRTDAVLVVNPDTRAGEGTVLRLLQVLAEPGAGIAAPRLLSHDGRLLHSLRRDPSLPRLVAETVLGGRRAGTIGSWGEVVHDPAVYEQEAEADWVSGAFMMMSRRCVDAVGPWDETFFLYSEETDFAMRTRAAGLSVRYTPEATAVHLEGDAARSPRLYSIQVYNRYRLYARHHGRLASAAFWAVLLVRELLRSPRRSTHRAAVRALLAEGSRPEELVLAYRST